MNKQKQGVLGKICLYMGIGLIVAATVMLVAWQWGINHWAQQARHIADALCETLPEPRDAFPEGRSDNTMPTLSFDEVDFVGVLEMPQYDSVLPVCGEWGKSYKYPCRFDGSIYDGSLQIGATTQKGQFDFYREVSVGDTVVFTDMEGNRYTFAVKNLRYAKHADVDTLSDGESALTLFVKNVYDFEYLIITCNVSC